MSIATGKIYSDFNFSVGSTIAGLSSSYKGEKNDLVLNYDADGTFNGGTENDLIISTGGGTRFIYENDGGNDTFIAAGNGNTIQVGTKEYPDTEDYFIGKSGTTFLVSLNQSLSNPFITATGFENSNFLSYVKNSEVKISSVSNAISAHTLSFIGSELAETVDAGNMKDDSASAVEIDFQPGLGLDTMIGGPNGSSDKIAYDHAFWSGAKGSSPPNTNISLGSLLDDFLALFGFGTTSDYELVDNTDGTDQVGLTEFARYTDTIVALGGSGGADPTIPFTGDVLTRIHMNVPEGAGALEQLGIALANTFYAVTARGF